MRSMRGDDPIAVPASTRFPVELDVPASFRVDAPETWPRVEGRLEWVAGRLLWMPPCGLEQSVVAVSLVHVLGRWADSHEEFVVGGNEAGVMLGDDVRAAEAAVWLRATVYPFEKKFARVPPVLAAEVAGRDEGEAKLLAKARWYLARGVQVVWVLLPDTRDVVVVTTADVTRRRGDETLPPYPALPGLEPPASAFFAQLD